MSRDSRSRPEAASGPGLGRTDEDHRGAIIEFTRIGDQMRVAAIDVASGAEAVAFGPVSAAHADLERLALNKLDYVMHGAGAGRAAKSADRGADAPKRPGRLV